MKTLKLVIAAVIAGSFFFASCEQTDNELTKATDESVQSILNITDLSNTEDLEEATSDDGTKAETAFPGCFDLIINDDTTVWRSWTLDFGTDGCESFNGILRQGKINITLTDRWFNEGSLRTISFEDFYVDSVHLEGIKTIENTGLNEAGNMTWTRKMTEGKLTYLDGSSTTWNCERYSERVEGGDTWVFSDDVYLVTGGSNGLNQDGLAFTTEITVPLKYVFGCRFPVSGELTINIEGSEPVVINFVDGVCDNLATQTTGDETVEIELGNR